MHVLWVLLQRHKPFTFVMFCSVVTVCIYRSVCMFCLFSLLVAPESTPHCVIASAGMQAEACTLHKVLDSRLTWYELQHSKKMSCTAVAQLLSNTLYYKRFFPYYAFNVLGGIDNEGEICWATLDCSDLSVGRCVVLCSMPTRHSVTLSCR